MPPLQPQTESPGYLHFCLASYKFRSSHDLPLPTTFMSNRLLEGLKELNKALSWLFKFIIKVNSKMKRDIEQGLGVLSAGASVPVKIEHASLLAHGCVHHLGSPPTLLFKVFFQSRFHYMGMIGPWWLNSTTSPLPFLEVRGGAESFNFNQMLSLSGDQPLSGDQRWPWSHLGAPPWDTSLA